LERRRRSGGNSITNEETQMSGHIRRRGKNSWGLKFDVPGANGARETKYISVKGTKREAAAKLTELLSQSARGTLVDPSKESFGQFLDRWDSWASTNLSGKTLERYRGLVANQVKPAFGEFPVQKLRAVHLQEGYAKLLQDGGVTGKPLSARSVGHVHRLIHRALGHAMTWGVIIQNPASLVSPPKVEAEEIEIIREEEVRTVLNALLGRQLGTIAMLALATGARRGELLALRYADVNLDAGTVRVERSLEQTGAGLAFKSPKTKHGRRTITIPATAVAELRAHKLAHQERMLGLGLGRLGADDLVFTDPVDAPLKPNAVTNDWLRATSSAGRSIGLHALRHTHASQLIGAGVDILAVSRRLGHANASITLNVYGHLLHDTDDKAAGAIEAMFARVGK
jgi:integrase